MVDKPPSDQRLRLWPGAVIAALLLLIRFGVHAAMPSFEGFRIASLGGLLCSLAILAWWAWFSRANRLERWGGVLGLFAVMALGFRFNHESMGLMWLLGYGLPVSCLALVVWAAACRSLANGPRLATLAAVIIFSTGFWTLIRTDGMTGAHVSKFAWRWTKTAEERLLDQARHALDTPAPVSTAAATAEWPGFRGPRRDGTVPGVRIETDWAQSPPSELWRRRIGPGWSSFAVGGGLLYTQEQRGEEECVSCYDAATGAPVWRHRDTARFYESMSGPGPRATPTLSEGRVYALGATGTLNALDAASGALLWSRDAAADAEVETPIWGFASSPLAVDNLVVIGACGRLVAYDPVSGAPRWFGPKGGDSYSSPQLATLDGVPQILLLSGTGATSATLAGATLWAYGWSGRPMVQPALTGDGDLLLNAGEGYGLRRLTVTHGPNSWSATERWTSNRLKPNFNGLVVHRGCAYGFDGRIMACIELEQGERKWKGGRYGQGQLLLLPDQNVLLVISEKGALALVEASPNGFVELAQFQAIEGKTWNHPALADDLLLVRNSREMAAFRLTLANR